MDCPACQHPNPEDDRFCAKCGALLPASPSEPDPLIGAVVGGRFRITGILGEGGMGRVYAGEQQMGTSVRKVAVKTLLAQHAKDPQVLARFMRECGTVSELEHPNTIRVHDFGQTDSGELYIAMELLSGVSLERALQEGPLPAERVDRILGQICGSLQEAHDKGIIHRDLKPANIYLTTRAGEGDYVKVLDFGIAKRDEHAGKREEKLTQQGTVLGTPPYMSPEQFRGSELDARSDIYSLAVMTYEMLTGRLPFDADTPWLWATQHMTAQPFPFETVPLGSQVPTKMKAAVMRALSKSTAHRQQTVREYYEDFTMGAPRTSAISTPRSSVPETIPTGGTATTAGTAVTGGTATTAGTAVTGGTATTAGTATTGGTAVAGGTGVLTSVSTSVPSSGGMPATPGNDVVAPIVPVPPPPTRPAQSNTGVILAVVVVVGVLAIVGTVLAVRSGGSGDTTDPKAHTTATATHPTATATATHPTATATHPTADAKSELECKSAISMANAGNVVTAANQYRFCEGPDKGAAHAAIDSAAQKSASRPGCVGLDDAHAADKLGLPAALNILKAKHCHTDQPAGTHQGP